MRQGSLQISEAAIRFCRHVGKRCRHGPSQTLLHDKRHGLMDSEMAALTHSFGKGHGKDLGQARFIG